MASKIKDFLLHLTHVDLSQNNIHTVTASLLRLARNLRHIDLSRVGHVFEFLFLSRSLLPGVNLC